jgi:Nucleotidyl transferase AbiEii toxin, Type IV TA system
MTMSEVFHPENLIEGPWVILLEQACKLIDSLKEHSGVDDPFWTLGGGTVLMFRYRHRRSKDIDVFVPDPQYLGYVNPRLSGAAAEVSQDYVEAAGYVKLIRADGEIDFVASRNLTQAPFEWWHLNGRDLRVETAAEIVAKKLWHRGHAASARDVFDLSLVIEKDPDGLKTAASYLIRHRESFLKQLHDRGGILKAQFDAIDTLEYQPAFEQARQACEKFLGDL